MGAPLHSNAHWFSLRTSSSSSGVKSFLQGQEGAKGGQFWLSSLCDQSAGGGAALAQKGSCKGREEQNREEQGGSVGKGCSIVRPNAAGVANEDEANVDAGRAACALCSGSVVGCVA